MDEQKNGLKKVLGFWDLMGIGVGQIIGSGIMVLTGICISITGAGTPFAFLLAAVLVFCTNLVLAVLGSAVPATGGMYTYVRDYIGKKAGFFYLALLVAGQLVLAMFAITFAEYACSIIPGLNETVVAFAILTLCFVMNIVGVDMAAKLQNVLVVVLVVAMALFSVKTITNNILLVNSLQAMMYLYAYCRFPKRYPEAWRNSRFHIPDKAYYVVVTVALGAQIAILLDSMAELTLQIVLVSLGAMAVCAAYALLRSRTGKVTATYNIWED